MLLSVSKAKVIKTNSKEPTFERAELIKLIDVPVQKIQNDGQTITQQNFLNSLAKEVASKLVSEKVLQPHELSLCVLYKWPDNKSKVPYYILDAGKDERMFRLDELFN